MSFRKLKGKSRLIATVFIVLAVLAIVYFALESTGIFRKGTIASDSTSKGSDQVEGNVNFEGIIVKIYHSPTCFCCEKYEEYLEEVGIKVESIETSNPNEVKKSLGVPRELWSCHTMIFEGYVVEGHVPLEALSKLLAEKPDIDGLALPGMPPGAPGIAGKKGGLLTVYAFSDGDVKVFMEF